MPINGGKYTEEHKDGGECYNFQDYNGYCYGYVMLYGDMALQGHFKGVGKSQPHIDNVTIIWVATNLKKETRIVGWYKNATLYREQQFVPAFSNRDHNLYYSMKAKSQDCYLLPEGKRTFTINRASQAGRGMGMGRSNIWYAESKYAKEILIPKVVDYIDNYKGEFQNQVFNGKMLEETFDEISSLSYDDLIEEGSNLYGEGLHLDEKDLILEGNNKLVHALKYFNSARLISETNDVLLWIANILFDLCCFDRARALYEKVIENEGDSIQVLESLMRTADLLQDREGTIKYCERMMALEDSKNIELEGRVYIYLIMFDSYVYLHNEEGAREMIKKISVEPLKGEDKELIGKLEVYLSEVFRKN